MDKVVIVVDAYSSGVLLAAAIHRYGFNCIHVQSAPPNAYFGRIYRADDFIDAFCFTDYPKKTALIQALNKKYDVVAVIPGCETGVEVADYLTENLSLPSNGTALSAARRNKYAMHEALKSAGVRSIPHVSAHSAQSIHRWRERAGINYPIVLKPPASAGTNGFHICRNDGEVSAAFNALYQTTNFLNQQNNFVLAEKYIQGQEYVVNTISLNGQHLVAEVMQVNKTRVGQSNMYDRTFFINQQSTAFEPLIAYTHTVLAALAIHHGAAHTEIIIDSETQQPVLVETASRLMGCYNQPYSAAVTGNDCVDLLIMSHLAPTQFKQKLRDHQYALFKANAEIELLSNREGTLLAYDIDQLRALPSYFEHKLYVKAGDKITVSRDINTSMGLVFLIHDDPNQILADYQKIRLLEHQQRLFKVRPPVQTSQAVMLFTKRPTTARLPIQQPAPGTLQAKL